MAIEITPKTGIRKNLWRVALLVFSIALFLSLLVSHFYINNLFEKLSQDIEEKEKVLMRSPSEESLEEELLLYESKVRVFDKLLSSHKKPLNTFLLLEQASHPNVWFSDFEFDSDLEIIIVSGQTKSFTDFGQQLIILKETKAFEKIKLSEISMGDEGNVDFSLQLILQPKILR